MLENAIEMPNLPPSKPLRILVVTHFFPPLNAIASHRPYSWARTWADMGHDVHVLTAEKYSFDGSMDLRYDLSGFRTHVVPYLYGKHNLQTNNADKKTVAKWAWLKRVSRRLRLGMGMFGDLRMLAYFRLVKAGSALLEAQPFDFIVSTYPPGVVHFVAYRLSQRFKVAWVADYRDLWFKDISGYAFKITCLLAGRVEARLLKRASLISTVSQGLACQIKNRFGRDAYICYNGYMVHDNLGQDALRKSDIRRIVYTGRIYKGLQDPAVLFRAISELKKSIPDLRELLSVDLYGYVDPWVCDLIEECKVGDCVHWHGVVSHQESLAKQKEADFLLFLDWVDQSTEGILTGKLFEYLGAGQPILSIGAGPTTEAAQVIKSCAAGIVMINEVDLRNFLEHWLKTNEKLTPTPNKYVISKYSRENQAKAFLKQIEEHVVP